MACKTVGSAYAGSSPAPATSQNGSSEPREGLFCFFGTCSRTQPGTAACHCSTNMHAVILKAFPQVELGFPSGLWEPAPGTTKTPAFPRVPGSRTACASRGRLVVDPPVGHVLVPVEALGVDRRQDSTLCLSGRLPRGLRIRRDSETALIETTAGVIQTESDVSCFREFGSFRLTLAG